MKITARRVRRALLLLTATLGFAGCGQYSKVSLHRPRFVPVTQAGKVIAEANRHDRRKPLLAIGEYISALRAASLALQKNPADAGARRDCNFALARIIETIHDAKLDPWTQPLRVPAPGGGEFTLTHRPDPRPQWNPALYEFMPADRFECCGKYVTRRTLKDGLGAPLVALARDPDGRLSEGIGTSRACYGVTVVARFEGANRCVLSLEDPLASENVIIGGRPYPLAADFTVPLAVMLARENPRTLELARLLRPAKYDGLARISRLQPYDPKKIPVIFVHGLWDSGATWTPMINALRGDAEIRQRYQFWSFNYPSGYPYPEAAAIMRRQLDAINGTFPGHKKLILIGHSAGGLISRTMITDSGMKLWNAYFNQLPEALDVSPATRDFLRDTLIFRHRPEVGRVIFVSSPHRGSDAARKWFGRTGASLVKAPSTLARVAQETRDITRFDPETLQVKRVPNGVDALAPSNRFVMAIQQVPMTPGIPYHSIMGDRGKGGNKDHKRPQSTDGFVPYWSSHLEGARSELVVPSKHSAHQNPKAIEEVRCILMLHAGSGR